MCRTTNYKNLLALIGKRYSRWTVVSLCEEKDRHGSWYYECLCDCGNTGRIMRGSLTSGKSQSCGCLNAERSSVRAKEQHQNADVSDMIGQRFGRLVVVSRHTEVNSDNKYPYVCRCDCGGDAIVGKSNLRHGRTKSCGCAWDLSRKERHALNSGINLEEYQAAHIGEIAEDVKRVGFTQQLKASIIERDNECCYLCDCPQEECDLDVHHIEPWSASESMRLNKSNLITLCKTCHIIYAHDGFPRGPVNPELAEIFKEYTSSFETDEDANSSMLKVS